MLAEAMPAATSAGALGIDSLLALWVVALADPEWIMPPRLARQAVAAALRAQGRDTNQWVGFMRQSRKGEAVSSLRHIELEDARSLEDADTPTDSVCHPEGVGKEDTRRLGRRPEGVSEEGERLGRGQAMRLEELPTDPHTRLPAVMLKHDEPRARERRRRRRVCGRRLGRVCRVGRT
jgi:hypothetical protein